MYCNCMHYCTAHEPYGNSTNKQKYSNLKNTNKKCTVKITLKITTYILFIIIIVIIIIFNYL